MRFIGIDPGLTGAVAVLDNGVVRFHDAPVAVVGKRRVLVPVMMAGILRLETAGLATTTAVLEAVHSMPRQGVASAFSFGKGVGIWVGILAALGVPYTEVAPQTWKRVMMRDMGKDKDASRLRAMQLFPAAASELARKGDHGRAEALLLAFYGKGLA